MFGNEISKLFNMNIILFPDDLTPEIGVINRSLYALVKPESNCVLRTATFVNGLVSS